MLVWNIPMGDIAHLLLSHFSSSKYQKHFSGTNAPPVAQRSPTQRLRDCCIFCAIALTWLVWFLMQRSVLSTNPKAKCCWCSKSAQMNVVINPSAIRVLNSGVPVAWGVVPLPLFGCPHSSLQGPLPGPLPFAIAGSVCKYLLRFDLQVGMFVLGSRTRRSVAG